MPTETRGVFFLIKKKNKCKPVENFFFKIITDAFCEVQAFTYAGTLEAFKKREAENTDQVPKNENR